MGSSQSKISVAIDFGTKFTGFAYMFNEESDRLYTATHGSFLPEDRVPTVLLLNADCTFNSFGTDAEDNYAKLMTRDKHHEYRLFRDFKMALYTQNERLNIDIDIFDTEMRPTKAMTVFSIIIRHLKELTLQSIRTCKISDKYDLESCITWILSIPAIWSDSARQFMRDAAVKAGIDEKHLRLVLEPEAAAFFCKEKLSTEFKQSTSNRKYILADLGGGTADFCVHEILPNQNIRELYRASGGAFGGSNVYHAFVQFLIKLFSAPVIKRFKTTRYFDYLILEREFERNKNAFDLNTDEIYITIPRALLQMVDNSNDLENSLHLAVAQSVLATQVDVIECDKLVCKRGLFEEFFKYPIDGISKSIQDILNTCQTDKLDTLVLVGGFSESKYLREIIKQNHQQLKHIVLPQESRMAVLKGALQMELKPNVITERRARHTYGFCVAEPFLQDKHPTFLKFEREGKEYCDRIFCKVIEKDMILTPDQVFKVNVNEQFTESKNINLMISLFRSPQKSPKYCLESNECEEVGKIIIESPRGGWPKRYDIDQILIAGETELKVQAKEKITGQSLETKIDFL